MSNEIFNGDLSKLPAEERYAESRRRALEVFGCLPDASDEELNTRRATLIEEVNIARGIKDIHAEPKERITSKDTMIGILLKVTDNNSGSMEACLKLIDQDKLFRPGHFLYGYSIILALDREHIWDERIYMLWNDVCGNDTRRMYALITTMRDSEGIDNTTVQRAIDDPTNNPIDFNQVEKVFLKYHPIQTP